MSNDYFNYQKCVDDLTAVLSIGYFFKYSTDVIEKRISNSKYFANFNKDFFSSESYISTDEVIESIYFDADIDDNTKIIVYNELEWVSMMYIHIIKETGLGFEAIFCYAPIEKASSMYHLYHELDFSKCVEWFYEQMKKESIIKIAMKRLHLTNEYVSSKTNISSSMIDALKNRRRDVRKLDVERAIKLSKTLNINIETLLI
ncbi:MAG: helix-turn-helix transcriptional regulator [Bacilli bacterium]|nr:helix-turn-helix transcriptional regulator [Bacilli bacterium]